MTVVWPHPGVVTVSRASWAEGPSVGPAWLCSRCPCVAVIRQDRHLSGDTDSGNKGGERSVKGCTFQHHLAASPHSPACPSRASAPPLLQECGGGGTPLGHQGEIY